MNTTTAAKLMTRKLLTAHPDWSVEHLMEFLSNHGISGAPVVSESDGPIGVVSLTDVARHGASAEGRSEQTNGYYRTLEEVVAPEELARFHVQPQSEVTVRDIMTPMVFAVDENAPAQEIAEMMIKGRIHRVFVKQKGKLAGVITSMDLLALVRDM